MKKLLLFFVFLSAGFSTSAQLLDEVKFIQDIFKMEKASIVDGYIDLTQDQEDPFWSLYLTYENERQAIGRRRIALLQNYAQQHQNLRADQADQLVNDYFAIQRDTLKLRKKYYKKFKKIIGSPEAASFVQLEEYIENGIRYNILDAVPFLGETE